MKSVNLIHDEAHAAVSSAWWKRRKATSKSTGVLRAFLVDVSNDFIRRLRAAGYKVEDQHQGKLR